MDAGKTWSEIETSDLLLRPRSIEFAKLDRTDVLIAGGVGGVWAAINPVGNPIVKPYPDVLDGTGAVEKQLSVSWDQVGVNFPNAEVFDIIYSPKQTIGGKEVGDVSYCRYAWPRCVENDGCGSVFEGRRKKNFSSAG